MHRTIISFVQPQPNSIQNKNNPIGCGTAPGNLVSNLLSIIINVMEQFMKMCQNCMERISSSEGGLYILENRFLALSLTGDS